MGGGATVRWAKAVALLLAAITAAPSRAREYFVSNAPGSGSGTAADPFGMADLPDPTSEKLRSKALENLQPGDTLSFRGGDKVHLAFLDFNLYDAAPRYEFGEYAGRHQKFTLADMRAKGFEKHSEVVAGVSELFVDEKSWQLKPRWAKAGKNGDAPGPDNVAEILNLSRYGPAALAKPAAPRETANR